jgi:hypothetical protein
MAVELEAVKQYKSPICTSPKRKTTTVCQHITDAFKNKSVCYRLQMSLKTSPFVCF